jgi:NAD(P)-dependent dehydrogenase (short-subunit alcohol dehydrogenase family)
VLTQGVVHKWVANKKKGKVVFTSSMGGLFTPANWGIYVSTKHALEAIAEAMQQELVPYGIKVQTINPGAYYTGYNETMADNPFRWLDDSKHVGPSVGFVAFHLRPRTIATSRRSRRPLVAHPAHGEQTERSPSMPGHASIITIGFDLVEAESPPHARPRDI